MISGTVIYIVKAYRISVGVGMQVQRREIKAQPNVSRWRTFWNKLLGGDEMEKRRRLSDEEIKKLIESDPKFRELVETYRKKIIGYIERAKNAKSPDECHELMAEYVNNLMPEMQGIHLRLIEALRTVGIDFDSAITYKLEEFGFGGKRF